MKLRLFKTLEGCNPSDNAKIIDIGCGPGHYCVALAKKNVDSITGVDFASEMIEIAQQKAISEGVEAKCKFICNDFMTITFNETFDYSIVMGFMDYVDDPEALIEKVLSITSKKAFFSFPLDGGFLAWKRKIKYKNRCKLFLYKYNEIEKLFENKDFSRFEIEKISRDAFVTIYK
jgi:ubiquinone/menaquinone biosynthesis C-methylase UbiE